MDCPTTLRDVLDKVHQIERLEQENAALRYQVVLQDAEIVSLYTALGHSRGLIGRTVDLMRRWLHAS